MLSCWFIDWKHISKDFIILVAFRVFFMDLRTILKVGPQTVYIPNGWNHVHHTQADKGEAASALLILCHDPLQCSVVLKNMYSAPSPHSHSYGHAASKGLQLVNSFEPSVGKRKAPKHNIVMLYGIGNLTNHLQLDTALTEWPVEVHVHGP